MTLLSETPKKTRPRKKKAWGKGRVYRRGNSWCIRWTENGIRYSDAGHDTQDNAQLVLDGILANIQAGRPGMPEKRSEPLPTFKALIPLFFESREQDDHRSVSDDRSRWTLHLAPLLENKRIDQVDASFLANLTRDLRNPPILSNKKALSNATVGHVLHLLSAFYKWVKTEKKLINWNPVKDWKSELSSKAKKRIKSDHDSTSTQFLPTKQDIINVFQALPAQVNIAFALSALAGLRPGEVLALEWGDIDLDKAEIYVARQYRNGKVNVPKSGKPRIVEIVPGLLTVLKAHKEAGVSDTGIVCQPLGIQRGGKYLNLQVIYRALDKALTKLGLPLMTWYEAGRHTFASQWVLSGNDIYRLSKLMGHSSVTTTERYAHLTKRTPTEVLARADVNLVG